MFVQVTAKMFEMFFETQCSILSNALLTASLFWDCDRFWSFGLLCCLTKKFVSRSSGAPPPYTQRPGKFCPPVTSSLRHWLRECGAASLPVTWGYNISDSLTLFQ